jgi:hypothetical protein
VTDGTYRFELMAEGHDGEPMTVTTYANGTVSGVTFSENTTYLVTDERKIPVGDVIQVNQKKNTQSQD